MPVDTGTLSSDEFAPYYAKYIELVPRDAIVPTLSAQIEGTLDLLGGLSEAEASTKQPPYTWSFPEVLGHLIDTERVMAYRALRIARNDATPLAGFEENDYVREANFERRPMADLSAEFRAVRESTVWLFRGLDGPAWTRRGTANNVGVSVRALAFIIAGHERHHARILGERIKSLRGGPGNDG